MRIFILGLLALWSGGVLAISCDCEVRVFSPMTGSHRMNSSVLKVYELDEYSSYSLKNRKQCRKLCLERFQEDMPSERLSALLLTYSQKLIEEGLLGYNCTGLTNFTYPVRVKATLGNLGLGNVADVRQVVVHEERCF